MSSVICRIEANGWGYRPPRDSFVEARAEPEGFSVWFADALLKPDATQIARRDSPYDARELAGIIVDHRLATQDTLRWPVMATEGLWVNQTWRKVTVTGERGLKAHMLAVAFLTDPAFLPWLQQQSDASLALLEALVGETIEGDWQSLLGRIRWSAERRKLDGDALSLLRRYDLPASAANLRSLPEWLDNDGDPQGLAQLAERQARLAPFRHEIETIAGLSSDQPIRGGGTTWPSHRSALRAYLEQYVLEHGRLPEGEINVVAKCQNIDMHIGTHDFDCLRKEVLGE